MFFQGTCDFFRSCVSTYLCAIFLPFCVYCHAYTPNPFSKESKFLISEPVLNLHEECSKDSPFVSQGVYGHSAHLVKEVADGWVLIETEDGYQGYALLEGLVPDDPRWRTSKRLCRVSSVAGMVYPIADTERPALMRLPFASRVELIENLDSNEDRWLEVQLVDGRYGWMQRGDLEKPKTRSLEEMIQISHKFLERPYVWGGTSSEGFDCSGYVQTLCKQIGVLLPRDSRPQAASEKVYPIEIPEYPGDLVFFGGTRITHVGLYLGDGRFIHSGVRDNMPKIAVSTIGESDYNLLAARRIKEIAYKATISPITAEVKAKMTYSWGDDNPVPLENLRYIQLNHWGFDGCVHDGELVVHQRVANEVMEIFEELFAKQYPIEKILLVDSYQADDDLTCEDNNSSAFCSRPITGRTTEWSFHSFGLAIDINPLLNPYHKGHKVVPANGQQFLDRSIDCHGVITEDDLCYKAFISRGWKWGGHWTKERGYVDYQHFYKEISY